MFGGSRFDFLRSFSRSQIALIAVAAGLAVIVLAVGLYLVLRPHPPAGGHGISDAVMLRNLANIVLELGTPPAVPPPALYDFGVPRL